MQYKLSDKIKKALSILGWILTGLIVALLIYIFVQKFSGNYPELFGYRMFRVVTNSMEPELMVGDVILVKETPVTELNVGDDVTYLSEALNGQPVTHRMIISPSKNENDGTYTVYTKGIREGAAADTPFSSDKLLGKVVKKLYVMTFIYKIFDTPVGFLVLLIPIIAIIAVEAVKIFKNARKGDGKNEEQVDDGVGNGSDGEA